jgi:hypothetical protein
MWQFNFRYENQYTTKKNQQTDTIFIWILFISFGSLSFAFLKCMNCFFGVFLLGYGHMDLSLCHIKKILKNYSSTRPRIYIVYPWVEEYCIFRTINLDKNDDFVYSIPLFCCHWILIFFGCWTLFPPNWTPC